MQKIKVLTDTYPRYFRVDKDFHSEDYDVIYKAGLFYMIEESNHQLDLVSRSWYLQKLVTFVSKPSANELLNSMVNSPANNLKARGGKFTGTAEIIRAADKQKQASEDSKQI